MPKFLPFGFFLGLVNNYPSVDRMHEQYGSEKISKTITVTLRKR